MKYLIFIHPGDALPLTDSALNALAAYAPFEVVQYTQDDFQSMKMLMAPGVADEEFWPKGTAYIVQNKFDMNWKKQA